MNKKMWVMRTLACLVWTLWSGAFAAEPPQTPPHSVRFLIRFGLQDKAPTKWDGEVRVSDGAQVVRIEGWRFGREDRQRGRDARKASAPLLARAQVEGSRWQATTRPILPNNPFQMRIPTDQMPPSDNGILVTLNNASPTTRIEITTPQGNFGFALGDVPYGKLTGELAQPGRPALDGQADVRRTPPTWQLTAGSEEEDFPAAASAPDGTLYLAYVAFTHGKDFLLPKPITEPPKDFAYLAEPTGGEKVMMMSFKNGGWSAPTEIASGQDIFRCAVAVDSAGQPCVVWSEQREGNFDLYARTGDKTVRLTTDAGPDIAPVAATDAEGKVWIAWMAGRPSTDSGRPEPVERRKDNFDIHVARLAGDQLADEQVLGATPADEWNPAIAASKDGEVAVAWDTYAKGDYDVYLSTAHGGRFGAAMPVAASPRFEARPSVVYDGENRLWVAWEDGTELWGKDSGALVKDKGSPLYRNRQVRVKVFVNGRPYRTAGEIDAARPLKPDYGPLARGVNNAGADPRAVEIVKPGPNFMKQPIPWDQPRLGTDGQGRVWVAFRSRSQNFPSFVGNCWYEQVTTCDGDHWLPGVLVCNTDNNLDSRPAFAVSKERLFLFSAADGRHYASAISSRGKMGGIPPAPPRPDGVPAINNDIWVAEISAGADPNLAPPKLEPVDAEPVAEVTPATIAERSDIARIRAYRATIAGQELRIMRGEFHRHTEMSQDGQNDGSLEDMWRYALDAVAMDWLGCGDHDNGAREYPWWITQQTTDAYLLSGAFVPMFSYERSCNYPDGHRNVVFAKRGVRPLPRLQGGFGKNLDSKVPDDFERPHSPDTQMVYQYLAQFDGICASHTSATDQGTDWRDADAKVEPVVEIHQGCRQSYERPDGPRAPTQDLWISGMRPLGFVSRALLKGLRLGFQSSSDHGSTHISFCMLWTPTPTREAMLDAFKKRHVYGATDNIIADVRCLADGKEYFMGDEFNATTPPCFRVHLIGTAPIAKVSVVRDNEYVYVVEPNKQDVEFEWIDQNAVAGKTSYYYVRGEQVESAPGKKDGELVWVSPMWITNAKR